MNTYSSYIAFQGGIMGSYSSSTTSSDTVHTFTGDGRLTLSTYGSTDLYGATYIEKTVGPVVIPTTTSFGTLTETTTSTQNGSVDSNTESFVTTQVQNVATGTTTVSNNYFQYFTTTILTGSSSAYTSTVTGGNTLLTSTTTSYSYLTKTELIGPGTSTESQYTSTTIAGNEICGTTFLKRDNIFDQLYTCSESGYGGSVLFPADSIIIRAQTTTAITLISNPDAFGSYSFSRDSYSDSYAVPTLDTANTTGITLTQYSGTKSKTNSYALSSVSYLTNSYSVGSFSNSYNSGYGTTTTYSASASSTVSTTGLPFAGPGGGIVPFPAYSYSTISSTTTVNTTIQSRSTISGYTGLNVTAVGVVFSYSISNVYISDPNRELMSLILPRRNIVNIGFTSSTDTNFSSIKEYTCSVVGFSSSLPVPLDSYNLATGYSFDPAFPAAPVGTMGVGLFTTGVKTTRVTEGSSTLDWTISSTGTGPMSAFRAQLTTSTYTRNNTRQEGTRSFISFPLTTVTDTYTTTVSTTSGTASLSFGQVVSNTSDLTTFAIGGAIGDTPIGALAFGGVPSITCGTLVVPPGAYRATQRTDGGGSNTTIIMGPTTLSCGTNENSAIQYAALVMGAGSGYWTGNSSSVSNQTITNNQFDQ